jgi:hypothetical protein
MVEIAAFIIVAYAVLSILSAMAQTGCLGNILKFFGWIIIAIIAFGIFR